jgi:hypothetical protein
MFRFMAKHTRLVRRLIILCALFLDMRLGTVSFDGFEEKEERRLPTEDNSFHI